MKIVIDISDSLYDRLVDMNIDSDTCSFNESALVESIQKGTPLPKGHGRLIDADELEELFGEKCVGDCGCCMTKRKTDGRGRWYDTCSLIDISPTIIEADKESRDKK